MPRPLLRLVVTNRPEQSFRERFWPNYPRKVAKKDAEAAWITLDPNEGLITVILKALDWQARVTTDWQYWPYAATWLRGRRWEDEPPPHLKTVLAHVEPQQAAVDEQMATAKRFDDLMATGLTREQAREVIHRERGWTGEPPEDV